MKTCKAKNRIIAALAAGFVLAVSTQAAFAMTLVVRHGSNIVHPQLYDSNGKTVNRLPARSYGKPPKKAVCHNNICKVVS